MSGAETGPGLPEPDAVCDGGDLDCGSGLLLIIRDAFQPLAAGGVLEVRSREASVAEDLPAWCRMVGHAFLGDVAGEQRYRRYFLRKKGDDATLGSDLETARRYVWKVRVRWEDGMRAKAFVRNHAFAIGQPASFDTEDAAPSALEYLLAALAGSLAVGFQWRASRRGLEVRNLEVSLSARAENILVFLGLEKTGSPGLASVEGRLWVDMDGDDADLDAVWRETFAGCPVAESLLRKVAIRIEPGKV